MRIGVAAAIALSAFASEASAQFVPVDQRQPRATYPQAFAWNVAVGGLTAAVEAAIGGRDVRKAFLLGLGGGAIHGVGKIIGTGDAFPSAYGGLVVSSVGASVVANAGLGQTPFATFLIPVGVARLYVSPGADKPVRFVLDGLATGVLVHSLTRGGLAIDWNYTAHMGAPIFLTQHRFISNGGKEPTGVTTSTVVAVSQYASDFHGILRHEMVHVEQYLFAEEAVGRPVEAALRSKFDKRGWVPKWASFGFGTVLVNGLDALDGNNGPLHRYVEWEAYGLAR